MPRRSKASIRKSEAMKKSWAKRKAAKEVKVTITSEPKRMKVRVISLQDGYKYDVHEIDTLGELFDILTGNYLGIVIADISITANSTLL